MTRTAIRCAAVAVLLASIGGCSAKKKDAAPATSAGSPTSAAVTASSTPDAASSAPAPAGGGSAITIKGFAFSPAALTVHVGTKVTVTNKSSATHTFTSVSGPVPFDSDRLAPDATADVTFSKAGTYAYHCSIHNSMTGTIVVS